MKHMDTKRVLTVLQIAITLIILVFLFRKTEQNKLVITALVHADPYWIAAAIGVFGLVELVAIIRWQILLRVQGIWIGWRRIASLFMIGTLFNPFMPGGTGGDIAKIYYLLKETPNKRSSALLAVLMDRLIGLFGLLIIAGTVIISRYQWFKQTPITTTLLYIVIIVISIIITFILVTFSISGFGLIHKLPNKMPLREQVVNISEAYHQYVIAWESTLLGLLLCIPVHFGSFTLFYCVSQAYTDSSQRATIFDFWGIMPIVNILVSIPISMGGIGIREGLFIKLLGELCHIPEMTAITISLTGYSVIVFWSLIGGVVYYYYRPSKLDLV